MTRGQEPNGVLPVDKPGGPTSHDLVAAARRALGTSRVGHAGTLDPFATGLLLLCVGPATRVVEFLVGLPKEYLATARLGTRTTTDDPEGEVEVTSEAWRGLGEGEVTSALQAMLGRSAQTPPRFSAKKVGGESAHYRARRGEVVELAPVEIEVLAIEPIAWRPPEVDFRVRCSSGTYIRVLARDLGERLGCGAHLTALRRTAVGTFRVETALSASQLDDEGVRARAWITPEAALAHLPQVEVDAQDAARLAHGQAVALPEGADPGGPVVVLSDRSLVAVADRRDGRLRPRKVFRAAS